MTSRSVHHCLAAAIIVAILAGVVRGETPRPPVFFEHPDPGTAHEIQAAIDDLSQSRLFSDHTRGREKLIGIGYWAVSPILKLLGHGQGDASEIRNGALALGTIGDPRARDALVGVAEGSHHQYVGSFATLALGRFDDPSLLPVFDALLRTRDKPDRRVAAVLALARLGGPKAYEILLRTAREPNPPLVREAAIFCLGFFPEEALLSGDGGKEPCPTLKAMLRSSKIPFRRAALLALAILGRRDLKPYFVKATTSELEGDAGIRSIALLALGRFPDRDVTDLLLRSVDDAHAPQALRVMAAFLLKDRKDPAALARLKLAVRGARNDTKIRAVLCLALSNFEDEGGARILIRHLADRKSQVRVAAAIGLSRFTTPLIKHLAIGCMNRLLEGKMGPLVPEVRQDMRLSREILRTGKGTGQFVWLGNQAFAEDLPKDVEDKVLDLVNHEAWQVLGLNSLTDVKMTELQKDRYRVDDRNSDLHDLREHLVRHPYFGPRDLPEPKLVLTPRDKAIVGNSAARPRGKSR